MVISKKCGYKHIIWDWNGTLFDDIQLSLELINSLLSRYMLPAVTLSRYKDVFGFPVKEYYRKVGFDFDAVAFEKVAVEFIDAYNRRRYEAGLYLGAHEILNKLSEKGVVHSVLSAYRQKELEETINRLGIGNCFERISGISDQFAASKIKNGQLLIEKIAHSKKEIVMIGDTCHDFEVARAMGVDCILVSHGHYSTRRLKKCGVPVIGSLNELPNRL